MRPQKCNVKLLPCGCSKNPNRGYNGKSTKLLYNARRLAHVTDGHRIYIEVQIQPPPSIEGGSTYATPTLAGDRMPPLAWTTWQRHPKNLR